MIGHLGFSAVKKEKIWNNEDITVMKLVSEIFVNVLNRKKSEAEKKRLEQQIRQAQKMEAIGTLAGGIAHDFNNILGIIQGYTELTLDDLSDRNMSLENMNQVLKACSRAQDLVKQILSFSRQNEQERKSLNLSLIIKEAIKLLRPSLPATIEIKQNIKGKSCIIMADVTQMHQILMNLSTNAAHAMREKGGILGITLEHIELDHMTAKQYEGLQAGNYAKLSVSDTGHGMNRSVMERIFDPYFTTKKTGEGTGMGLSVVHGIVKSHGGEITVYSEPGKGTVFHVYIPLVETYQKEEKEDLLPLRGGKERILFVDDEKNLVDFSIKMLDRLGYKVTSAEDSREALEIFLKEPDSFDIIITDQTMPVMTGVELSEKILNIRSDIPIIICTGFSESIDSEKAEDIGIKQLLMKPFTVKDISLAIRKALEQ
ncbi:MAG: ATP-binding protein [Candidatus Eremiobacterota bacterium]